MLLIITVCCLSECGYLMRMILQVILVVPRSDIVMHVLPTEEQEMQAKTNYGQYISPDADNCSLGVLAARTVRDVGKNIFDHVKRVENPMSLAPLTKVEIPSVKTFSFIAATDEADDVGACVSFWFMFVCLDRHRQHIRTHLSHTQHHPPQRTQAAGSFQFSLVRKHDRQHRHGHMRAQAHSTCCYDVGAHMFI